MNVKKLFPLVLILVAVSLMMAVPLAFSQQCTAVPGTRYNMDNVNRWLTEANQFLGRCSGSNYNDCREADKRLGEADVAIIQILTECTRGNCLRGRLDILAAGAGRLAELSRRLVRQSGMRRTYDNTLVTVNSWRSTRMCPTDRCQQYARTAVSQNQENLRRRCGFTGTRWTNEYKGHYDWCFTAPQNLADAETKARADALRQCQSRPSHGPRCQQYARTAVSQNQENMRRGCGFTGARWTNEYQGHYNWCLAAQQSLADAETKARADALRQCKPQAQARSCPGPGMTVIHKLVNPPPYTGYSVICRDGSGKLWMQGANAAPITSIVKEQWNSQTGCYDRSRVVISSRTIEGRLCKP